jgi:hypothetical protein
LPLVVRLLHEEVDGSLRVDAVLRELLQVAAGHPDGVRGVARGVEGDSGLGPVEVAQVDRLGDRAVEERRLFVDSFIRTGLSGPRNGMICFVDEVLDGARLVLPVRLRDRDAVDRGLQDERTHELVEAVAARPHLPAEENLVRVGAADGLLPVARPCTPSGAA